MSEQSVLTIIGLLITVLLTAGGFVFRVIWAKLVALEKKTGDLPAFIARFDATERSWESWREGIDERLNSHGDDIKRNGNRLTRLERNGGAQ